MLLTLLGFSAACSTVRNGAGSDAKTAPESAEEAPEMQVDTIRAIRVLYGVRRPQLVPKKENGSSEQKEPAKPATTEEESR